MQGSSRFARRAHDSYRARVAYVSGSQCLRFGPCEGGPGFTIRDGFVAGLLLDRLVAPSLARFFLRLPYQMSQTGKWSGLPVRPYLPGVSVPLAFDNFFERRPRGGHGADFRHHSDAETVSSNFLHEAIASVQNRSHPKWECIVVDERPPRRAHLSGSAS